MASGERRKRKGCHKLFRPDPRNRYHQRYCAAASCRAASKAASQARWLAAAENQDYFRGPAKVARVEILLRDDLLCPRLFHHLGIYDIRRRARREGEDL